MHFHCSPLEITVTLGNPIHEHIRIDENSKVAFMDNSERTLCTLSHLNWHQVVDIMSSGKIDVFHYPPFMKLHASLLTILSNDLKDPVFHEAEHSLLSIRFSPLAFADEKSLKAAIDSLLKGYTLRVAPYARSHSPAWESITREFHQNNDTLPCILPLSVELSHSSHGVELADLRGLSFNCLIHLIHHAAENPWVISIAIFGRPTLMNYEARGISQSGKIYIEPYREAGLTGLGQVCGVADSGVNDRSCFLLDDSKAYPTTTTSRDGELQPLRRKIIKYVAYADDSEDEAGHGTHVCGSIGEKSFRRNSCKDNDVI